MPTHGATEVPVVPAATAHLHVAAQSIVHLKPAGRAPRALSKVLPRGWEVGRAELARQPGRAGDWEAMPRPDPHISPWKPHFC